MDYLMNNLGIIGAVTDETIMAMVKTFDIDMDAIIGSLPCPFCGSETMIEGHPFGDSATESFRVTCEQNGHSLDRWDSTKRAAIVAWNKRP